MYLVPGVYSRVSVRAGGSYPKAHRLYYVCRFQLRQALQPQEGSLFPWVSKLVRLYVLCVPRKSEALHLRRVFYRNSFAVRLQKSPEKARSLHSFLVAFQIFYAPVLVEQPDGSSRSQVCTWRESDYHVPFHLQKLQGIHLKVVFRVPPRTKLHRSCMLRAPAAAIHLLRPGFLHTPPESAQSPFSLSWSPCSSHHTVHCGLSSGIA